MLFSSTLVVRYKVQIKQKLQRHNNAGVLGGRGWITQAAHLKKPRRGFFPAGLFGGSMLFESTRSVRLTLLYNKNLSVLNTLRFFGGAKQPKSEPLPSGESLAVISSKVMVFVPSL